MSHRPRSRESRDIGNRGVSTQIQKNPVRSQTPRASLFGFHFERPGTDQTSFAEDQLGSALLVVGEVSFHQTLDHFTLALTNALHPDGERLGFDAEFRRPTEQRCHLSAM